MTDKEQIKKDIVVAFDFARQIIDNTDILDEIPNGAEIIFIDNENVKPEKEIDGNLPKKYIRVKRKFEIL